MTSIVVFLGAWLCSTAVLAQAETQPQVQDEPADTQVDSDARSLDREARSLFEAGVTAYDDGRYETALEYFRRAYKLSDRPQLLFNVAQAADRLRLDDEVLKALRAYRERLPDADNAAAVDKRIRVLEARRKEAEKVATVEEASPPPNTPSPEPGPTRAAPSALDKDLQAAASSAPQAPQEDKGGLLSQWWLWAAAGAVVAGTVVGVVVASSGGTTVEDPVAGTDGVIVMTLNRR